MSDEKVPNPGSNAALDRGCTCAVLDNNHGKWAPWGPDGWWMTMGCPVHVPHHASPALRTEVVVHGHAQKSTPDVEVSE